jgi:hypothetical protein
MTMKTTDISKYNQIEISDLALRNLHVVSCGSVCGIMFGFFNGVVTHLRVKLRSFGVVGGSSVRSGVILNCLGGVVPGRSVGCSIQNWNIGLAFRFNVVRISRCLGGVVLRCLGGLTRG